MVSPKKIYGLIGYPVKHSFSPAMHNAAFKDLDIDAEYRLFEIKPEELEDFILNRKDIIGFNITIPYKVRAKEILEKKFPLEATSLTEEDRYYVKLSGAVNTVKRDGEYYNTDARGFLKSLQEDLGFETKGKNVLIIGCGGAGRSIIAALSWKQKEIKKIYIHDIDEQVMKSAETHFYQLPDLKDRLKSIASKDIPDIIKDCHLLVNASPVGMKEGNASPIDKSLLHKELFVYDLVYNRNTELTRDAKEKCKGVAGGLGMLLYQGAYAFERWTHQRAPVEVMRKALLSQMENRC